MIKFIHLGKMSKRPCQANVRILCITASYERLAHARFSTATQLFLVSVERIVSTLQRRSLQSAEQGREVGDGEARYRKTRTVL